MARIDIDTKKCTLCGKCLAACPFSAIEMKGGAVEINAACKLCKICVKKCPYDAMSFTDEPKKTVDFSGWKDILVFAEIENNAVHPVTFELIGKAKQLAAPNGQNVHCVVIGENAGQCAEAIKGYGLSKILTYAAPEYKYFIADVYAAAFADAINILKPAVVLVGATALGRSLAPRTATRFRTGLTADCTALEIRADGNLVQIRPAFGGDIMAQILTPGNRPQFATVRYKTMDKAWYHGDGSGEIIKCAAPAQQSRAEVLQEIHKTAQENISDAEIIVAGGRGLKGKKDLEMLQTLADALGGQLAGTRPLVEAGWIPYTRQIGLSGRTVKPRLIIACGISGAVQFTAAMREADCIIAINKDKTAPIFNVAHIGVAGDLYEVVPKLTERLMSGERCKYE